MRATADIDLVARQDRDNLERLAASFAGGRPQNLRDIANLSPSAERVAHEQVWVISWRTHGPADEHERTLMDEDTSGGVHDGQASSMVTTRDGRSSIV